MNANIKIKQGLEKHKSLFQYLLWLILCCASFACNNKKLSDKKVFAYNEATGIATLDPAFAKNQSIMWACRYATAFYYNQ